MKISIIIPVFNVDQFIERCILSALNQTYKNIEVVIIDDCGIDNSIRIAQNILNNPLYNKISKIVKHKKNRGLSAARNTGINVSSGEYVYFLDSDDEISLDCIELLVKSIVGYNPDFIIADYQIKGTDRLYPPLNLEPGAIKTNDEILRTYIKREWYMMAFNKLVKKSFLIKNELYFKEGIVHEDELWSFMLACKAETLNVIKNKTYIYNTRPGSITQEPTIHNLQSLSKIIIGMKEFIKKDEKLFNNIIIYNFYEELKSIYFFKILSSSTSKKFKYSFYIEIRNNNYLNTFPYNNYYRNFARIIRNIHYSLPSSLGFNYYKSLLLIKKSLKM